jgi:hypothetical protein
MPKLVLLPKETEVAPIPRKKVAEISLFFLKELMPQSNLNFQAHLSVAIPNANLISQATHSPSLKFFISVNS